MSSAPRPVTLVCPPGGLWYLIRFPACEVCGGDLYWWDCEDDLIYGCARCPDCGGEYYVRVISSDA